MTANDAFRRLVPPRVQDGQGIYEAQGGAWNTDDMHALLEGDLAVRDRRVQIDFPQVGLRAVRVDSHLLAGEESQGVVRFLSFSLEDPTG